MISPLAQSVEAILFATSEPQSAASLASRLSVTKEEIMTALAELSTALEGHGMLLTVNENTAALSTRPAQSAIIETIRKEELSKELSKASAETLAIVCYHPNATKAQIEFIRGVNASYSLRALQMRGLIEQKGTGRTVTYAPTLDALRHLGAAQISELPQYAETRQKIDTLLIQTDTDQSQE